MKLITESVPVVSADRLELPVMSFALIPDDLQTLLEQIPHFTRYQDMPRRIKLCQAALALVNRDTEPKWWAQLQDELGHSLSETPLGERAENIEQAIHHLKQALEVRTRPRFPADWAQTCHHLAIAYLYRIRGQRALNLEQAIQYGQQALEVYTQQAYPEQWAATENSLGEIYRQRIHGEQADNREQAIHHFKQALLICAYPFGEKWAVIQNNLALAYLDRIQGERAENIEQALSLCRLAIEVLTRQTFPYQWASSQHNLALAYYNRMIKRGDNYEQAISLYRQALLVFTPQAFPERWAMTQSHLALAFSNRIRGERAKNIEQAISHHQLALLVFTRQAFPEQWAITQSHLALAFSNRIRGERAKNIEQAISHHQLALEVLTRRAFPEKWAMNQHGLALALFNRLQGERAENDEQAISCYQLALEVYTRSTFPKQWAMTQSNLAYVYKSRIKGDLADNYEQAIHYHKQSLLVYTRQAYPEKWAKSQLDLAEIYQKRIRREPADNDEQAIAHYQLALEVFTRQAFPLEWAISHGLLALVYSERIQGERADNLEKVIFHCLRALKVYTRHAGPNNWAQTMSTLAKAYVERIQGPQAENLERAISYFRQVLSVYTQQTHPKEWAQIMNSLGVAYSKRIRGERADNIEQAIFHFLQTQSVYTRQAFPQDWSRTHNNLANAYSRRIEGEPADNKKLATHHFRLALEASYTASSVHYEEVDVPFTQAVSIDSLKVLPKYDHSAPMLALIGQHPEWLSDEFEALLLQEIANARFLGNEDGGVRLRHLETLRLNLHLIRVMTRKMGPAGHKMVLERLRALSTSPNHLRHLIRKFVEAPNWIAARAVVVEHPELLSDEANAPFIEMIASTQLWLSDEIPVHALQQRHELLVRCRREGIDAAFADRVLSEVVQNLVTASTWEESKRIVNAQHDLLLTDAADQVLADMLERFKDDADIRLLKERRTLLIRCRREGIDAAFADYIHSQQISQTMLAFIDANSWLEKKRLMLVLDDLQLTDAADQLLTEWQQQSKDNPDATRLLEEHHTLLTRSRDEGIHAAFADKVDFYEQSLKAVFAFVEAKSWPEKKRIVEIKQDLLFSDTADQHFVNIIAQKAKYINATYQLEELEEHRALLASCRREGIDVAFANNTPFHQQVAEALDEFSFSMPEKSREERIRLVLAKPELLLTYTADNMLVDWLDDFREQTDTTLFLQESRELLARCRREGIDAAFSKPMLFELTTEIDRLTHANDMPRRIELCRVALGVVKRDVHSEIWAILHNQLGHSLVTNPKGKRAENIEQAIFHYQLALEVYTRQAFPEEWADTQNKLADAYFLRIKGSRAANTEQAISHHQLALEVYTRQAFPEKWAETQNLLANAHLELVPNERAEKIEQAIACCRQALEVYTRPAFPEQWVETQNLLARAYLQRIKGTRAKNIEQAISHCHQALEVHTRPAFPDEWADIQIHLALVYLERVHGERVQNIELVISHSHQALKVHRRPAFPEKWATNQMNLAFAHLHRIRGERAENIEQSIAYSQRSLEVCTRSAFPRHWAKNQDNLAAAYLNRIRGERAENIEQAVYHCHQALKVCTRQAFPFEWAASQNSLGMAYFFRLRGERAENLEQAIKHIQRSLEVYTPQATPNEWANSQWSLAFIYLHHIRVERALTAYSAFSFGSQNLLPLAFSERIPGEGDHIEQAIDHLEQALTVYTRSAFPFEWARSFLLLAIAFSERTQGELADNLEQAIHYLKQALTVYTRSASPLGWANSQFNLANVYCERIREERAENLEQAIFHYRQALTVYTPQNIPRECLDMAYRLGYLLYNESRFTEAREALTTAHQAVEALRGQVQRETAKYNLSEESFPLYICLISCCLREGNEAAAFEYTIISKGRAFVDGLASARFNLESASANDPKLAADLLQASQLRQQIDSFLTQLTDGSNSKYNNKPLAKELVLLRNLQQQERQLWQELAYKYPALTATQSAPSLSVEQAQNLAAELDSTLVEFVAHLEGWSAFVVTPQTVRHVPLEGIDDEFWQDMVVDWLGKVDQPKYHNEESYYTLEEWYDLLIAPLKLPPTGKIVLAPANRLHFIPLSIARHPKTGRYLCDDYQITFAPSLAALHISLEQAKEAHKTSSRQLLTLLTAAYPGMPEWKTHSDEKIRHRYLPNVIPEAEAIAAHFRHVTQLHTDQATPQAVIDHAINKDVVHFSCHAGFDWGLPEQSGLALCDGFLTVQRIINELRLTQTRLVTLSACQTHLTRPNASEEHTGLVQALMTAGAKCVVASLWSVPEDATRVLFEHFYRAVAAGEPPATALQKAMQVVRQQPGWEHPFYWGAFQVSGLGF